jgi:hypothetical protein
MAVVHIVSGVVKKAPAVSVPVGATQISTAADLDQFGNQTTIRPNASMQVTPQANVHRFSANLVGFQNGSVWVNMATGATITTGPASSTTTVRMWSGTGGGFIDVDGGAVAGYLKQGYAIVCTVGSSPPATGFTPTVPHHVDPDSSGQVAGGVPGRRRKDRRFRGRVADHRWPNVLTMASNRGSFVRGHGKTGGRKVGTRNKRTLAQLATVEVDSTLMPLTVLLRYMRAYDQLAKVAREEGRTEDAEVLEAKAIECATRAAPYIHPKLAATAVDLIGAFKSLSIRDLSSTQLGELVERLHADITGIIDLRIEGPPEPNGSHA